MGFGGLTVVPESQFCLCPGDQPHPKPTRVFWEQPDLQAIHLQAEMADSVGMGLSRGQPHTPRDRKSVV